MRLWVGHAILLGAQILLSRWYIGAVRFDPPALLVRRHALIIICSFELSLSWIWDQQQICMFIISAFLPLPCIIRLTGRPLTEELELAICTHLHLALHGPSFSPYSAEPLLNRGRGYRITERPTWYRVIRISHIAAGCTVSLHTIYRVIKHGPDCDSCVFRDTLLGLHLQ
jgi:hypothetical protein